jgi:2-phospho-L-lactate guanylyltransferase
MTTGLVAAVPVKDLVNAKQRLVPALSPRERRELARAMLEDVLEVMVAALPGSVLVITTDPEVQALARAGGAECLAESANRGHTAAVAFAQREAAAGGGAGGRPPPPPPAGFRLAPATHYTHPGRSCTRLPPNPADSRAGARYGSCEDRAPRCGSCSR